MDGFNTLKKLIKIVAIPKTVKQIVMATDGYPKLFNTLSKTEKYLNYIKKNDPLCYKVFSNVKEIYYGQDSYDDRAYIRFEI